MDFVAGGKKTGNLCDRNRNVVQILAFGYVLGGPGPLPLALEYRPGPCLVHSACFSKLLCEALGVEHRPKRDLVQSQCNKP